MHHFDNKVKTTCTQICIYLQYGGCSSSMVRSQTAAPQVQVSISAKGLTWHPPQRWRPSLMKGTRDACADRDRGKIVHRHCGESRRKHQVHMQKNVDGWMRISTKGRDGKALPPSRVGTSLFCSCHSLLKERRKRIASRSLLKEWHERFTLAAFLKWATRTKWVDCFFFIFLTQERFALYKRLIYSFKSD